MVFLVWALPWILSDGSIHLSEAYTFGYTLTNTGTLIRIERDRLVWDRAGPFISIAGSPGGRMVLAFGEKGSFSVFDHSGRLLISGSMVASAELLGLSEPRVTWRVNQKEINLVLDSSGKGFPRMVVVDLDQDRPRIVLELEDIEAMEIPGLASGWQ